MASEYVDPFNSLLHDLNDGFGDNDVTTLKGLLENCIPKNQMEKLTTARDIFSKLVERGDLSKDKLGFLKAQFHKMKRQDLVDKIEGYERAHSADTDNGENDYVGKSVLILNDEWGTSKGGISTVHRQIAMQAKQAGFDVHVTTLQKPSDKDQSDAKNKGIHLVEAVKKGKLDLDCINITHETYFPDKILQKINPDIIIGHIPVTAEGAIAIGKDRLVGKRVFQFAHTIPEDTDPFKDGKNPRTTEEREDSVLEFARKSDAFFAIGPRIYNHYGGKFRRLENKKPELYIPYPDEGFFNLKIEPPEPNHPVRILIFGRVDRVGRLKGYDILAEALSKVCNDNRENPPKLDVRGVPDDKHEESEAFFTKYKTSGNLKIIFHPYESQTRIMEDLKQSHLVIMPSRSEPFGMVGMEAIAAGLPVLITKHSGLATFMTSEFGLDAEEMVVDVGLDDTEREKDINEWHRCITKMLKSQLIPERFKKAKKMKERLQDLKKKTESDNEYIRKLKRVVKTN